MSDVSDTKPVKERPPRAVRLAAFLLWAGGLFGAVIAASLGPGIVRASPILALIMVPIFVVYLICIWQGWRLRTNAPGSLKWARILYAAQIPTFVIPGLAYEFYTGANLSLMAGQDVQPIAFNLGSSMLVDFSAEATATQGGINLAAVALLILLVRARPPSDERRADPSS